MKTFYGHYPQEELLEDNPAQLIIRRFSREFTEPASERLPVLSLELPSEIAVDVPVWNLRLRSRMIATHYFN